MNRLPSLAMLLLVLVLTGCGDSDSSNADSQPIRDSRSTDTKQHEAEIEQLLALPYAGYVDQGEDDAEEVGVVLHDPEKSYPGLNLYCIHEQCRAELIDVQGRILRSWGRPGGFSWGNVELLENGDLLAVGQDPLPPGVDLEEVERPRYLLRFNWAGDLLWESKINAHHDVELTPRNQLLTLTYERRTTPEIHPAAVIKDVHLVLMTQSGVERDRFSLYEAIMSRPEVFPLARLQRLRKDGNEGKLFDLLHCNSIEWAHHKQLENKHPIYGPDSVLVCFRHQHRIAVFDWKTRQVIWAWGRNQLSGPHDAQYLANGNILLFDNGVSRKYSRVIELNPLTEEIVWEYKTPTPEDFFSLTKGSNQRLPNGNTLIANSDSGEAFEVTRAGEIVWRFICPHRDDEGRRTTIVRIKRYDPNAIVPLKP